MQLKNYRRHFKQNLHRKRHNNWHITSFIHCGSEKGVYRFPKWQLADARKEVASYMDA